MLIIPVYFFILLIVGLVIVHQVRAVNRVFNELRREIDNVKKVTTAFYLPNGGPREIETQGLSSWNRINFTPGMIGLGGTWDVSKLLLS